MAIEPNDTQQQIGYLISAVEDIRGEVTKIANDQADLRKVVEDKFRTAELTLKIFKFIGLVIVAVLTFKLGDVSKLWGHFFG